MSLNFDITGDNHSFINSLNQIKAGVSDATRQIEANGGSIDRVISNIKRGIATFGIATGLSELSTQIAHTRGEFQQLEVAFNTMLGNGDKADALMSQLVKTAATTPFDLQGVADGARQLLATGTAAEEVNEILIRLGDVAAGLSLPLGDLIYLYSTTMQQGQMFTQDLRQFQGRGIPIADEIAKQFGVAKDKVGELVTAGKVGAKEFKAAIISMTDEGSKFGGLMEAQSKTITGQLSNIEDAIDSMFNEIGKQTEGIISGSLSIVGSLVEHWQEVGMVLADIAAAYGVQKAVVAGAAAVTASSYKAELAALASLLPAKEQSANLDVAEALAKRKITEATAAKVIAMRSEHQAYMQSLQDALASAKAEEAAAKAKLRAALQASVASKQAVTAKKQELIASGEICGAYVSESAKQQLTIVGNKAKAASSQVAAARQEAHAASIAKKTAAEALETATTEANTVVQDLNTKKTTLLTLAKEGLAKTTKKLYTTLLANPYAVLTAAVLALGYGIYKAVTYQTDFEKAQGRLNEEAAKCEGNISAENTQIDILFNRLKKAKTGTEEWSKARDAIWSKYGTYLKSLGDEKTALNDVAAAYNLVKKNAEEAARARAMDSFMQKEGDLYAEKMGDIRIKALELVEKRMGKTFTETNKEAILRVIEGNSKATQEFLGKVNTKDGFFGRSGEFSRLIYQGREAKNNYENILKEAEDRFASTGSKSQKTEPPKTTLKEAYDKAKKDYEDAKSQVANMNANRAAFTEKEYETATSNLKSYKEAFEKLGGTTKETKGQTAEQLASKTATEEQQLTDLLKRQAEERLRHEQEYEYKRWQTRIDLMEEGEVKVLAQMELDNSKERTSLKQQEQQAIQDEINRQKALHEAQEDIKASKDKKYAKKTFNPDADVDRTQITAINERYDKLYADLKSKQQKAYRDRLDAAKQSMNAYLAEFGNYQQKRLAIQEEYDKQIAEAQNAGERMQLMAQRNQKISDLDFNEWQDNGGMALAFGDVSKLSGDTIKDLIAKMEEYRSLVIATFDPDKIQKFEDALNNLRMADVEMQFNFVGDSDIVESLKERLALVKQIDDEEANIAALQNQKAELEQRLNELIAKSLTSTLNTTAIGPDGQPTEQTGVGMSEKDVKLAEELRVKIMQIGNLLTKSTTNSRQLNSQLKQMQKVKFADVKKFSKNLLGAAKNAASLAEIFEDDIVDAISSGIEKVEGLIDVFDTVSSNIETLAKAGKDVVNSTVDASKQIVDGASAGMKASATATATSLSTMEKASAILAIIGAAIQVATLVASLFNSDKKHEKNIEHLQDRIDKLQKSYDKLGKAANESFSVDASELIDQQNTLLQQQKILIKQQIAEEEAKKKTDDEKIKEYNERLEEIDETLADNKKKAKEAIIGEDVKSAISEFAEAYASAWEDGTDAASKSMSAVKGIITSALDELLKKRLQPTVQNFYDKLAEYMGDGILEDWELAALDRLKAQMDEIAAREEEQYKMILDRYKDLDELKEELTAVSFDSVRDDFRSQLLDMEADAASFSDSFSDMLRNALVEGLMNEKYDLMLREWYDEFAEAMDDRTLTDGERDRLRRQYEEIVNQGIADRDAINDIVGGGSYSQTASQGGWETMGQDTAEELNGRFTAMTELQVIGNDLQQTQNTLTAQILATLQSMSLLSGTATGQTDPTLLAIKDMMFLSTGYLEDIRKYTKILNSVDERLAALNTTIDRKL